MPPKRWLELKIEVPFEYVEPVAELFHAYGKGGVVIEQVGGWNPDEGESPPPRPNAILRAYMPQTPAFRSNRELVYVGVQLIAKLTELPDLEEREIDEADWEAAWKAHFTPLRVGRRLVVQPPWQPAPAELAQTPAGEEAIVIEIDPGLAFGTGHHPTTHRALESIERLITPGANVLDVGAGSGILSIAAAKLGAGKVIGVEIDRIALKAGRSNVRANGVSGIVRLYAGTLPNEHVLPAWADLVVANVNALVLGRLAPELRRALKPGGALIAAGILRERLASVEQPFADAGLRVRESFEDDDWVAVVAG